MQIDPENRASIAKCLRHPLFDEIRSEMKEMEATAPQKIELKVDKMRSYHSDSIEDNNDFSVNSVK